MVYDETDRHAREGIEMETLRGHDGAVFVAALDHVGQRAYYRRAFGEIQLMSMPDGGKWEIVERYALPAGQGILDVLADNGWRVAGDMVTNTLGWSAPVSRITMPRDVVRQASADHLRTSLIRAGLSERTAARVARNYYGASTVEL